MITAIFDLDGTLTDSLQDLANAVNYGLRELGYPEHETEAYKKMVGNGAKKLCFRGLPENGKHDAEKLHELFRDYYTAHCMDNTQLYPGIRELLTELSGKGVALAVATNKPQDTARKIIGHLLPEIHFAKILGGCEERPKKPDPAIISEILADLPEDNTVYMAGDSNVDIRTAKNAGITAIGCTWGFRDRAELESEGADFIVDSADEILDIVLR